MKLCFIAVVLLSAITLARAAETGVILHDELINIPTYPAAVPDLTPIFFDGRAYQGAKGPVYPYPIIDGLSANKVDKSYRQVCLENRHVKFCVIPALGGRIFTGLDKTNGYHFFYQQTVIKPALIGMTGAWISGGVEWNIPHHHRASSFMPVDITTEDHPDGSRTIWVGEMELRSRMRWSIGLTLYPDKSYIEATMRLRNVTPVANTFLYFANVAVHANDDYQIIFPPSTQFAMQHAKVEFSRWPIATGEYGGVDFSRGVDVSWYKNHPEWASMFAFNCKEDFLAGYDHGRKAGTLHIADHGVMPGKKFFTWGTGDDGRVWGNLLTDSDGPYLELMVGGFSDNQPDYSWIHPYETKTVREYWYPYQETAGVKNANIDAAVNLTVHEGRATVGFNVTSAHPTAHAILRAGSVTLLDQAIAIDPATPFVKVISLPAGVREQDLAASLVDSGRTLVGYRPVVREELPMPAPVVPPPPPKRVKTGEELYLSGQRLEQFYSPAAEPDPYFEEALSRDPGDIRANTALGILRYKRGDFARAERLLSAAVERASFNYTSPKDGEPHYYLGLAQKALGNYGDARESLYKATWSAAWTGPAYFTLAELEAREGDAKKALELLGESLAMNARNTRALNLEAALLRRLDEPAEAKRATEAALAVDPLDAWARYEQTHTVAPGDVQPYLEVAVNYASAGLFAEAIRTLEDVERSSDKGRVYPMTYYWLAWLNEQIGNASAARRYYELAPQMPADYCFPFRTESIEVLRRAMEVSPKDARAPYYLGNLLYDLQPAEAIKAWERSRQIDDSFALTHRNLAFAYSRAEGDAAKAQASMQKAVALDARPRYVLELDEYNEAAGVSAEQRLAVFEEHPQAAGQRDDAMARLIRIHITLGHYDRAVELLSSRKFSVWEGGESMMHDAWVDVHLLRGDSEFRRGDYAAALKDYRSASDYPENLSQGRPLDGGRSAVAEWFVAITEQRLGDTTAMHAALAKAVEKNAALQRASGESDESAEVSFYRAEAARRLGDTAEAGRVSQILLNSGHDALARPTTVDYFAKFRTRNAGRQNLAHAHYVLALGYLGEEKKAEAEKELKAALEADPNHFGAKRQLGLLDADAGLRSEARRPGLR